MLSRRNFAKLAGAGLISSPLSHAAANSLTASQVMDRIRKQLGIPWNDKSFRDVFHAGDPEGAVHGIATTFMSTLDVIQRAHAKGLNFVISHEPTFWSDSDAIAPLRNDPLFKLKRDYIEKNDMMVFRFHDHWHARKPDGIFEGWSRALGWGDGRTWELPQTTLREAAKHVAKALDTRSLRFVGDPNLPIHRIGRGGHALAGNMAALKDVDALLVSEAREWDSIEYVRDSKKGLILISHEAGEEAGMDNCATWLKSFLTDVPVEFIPSHDQMWIPT